LDAKGATLRVASGALVAHPTRAGLSRSGGDIIPFVARSSRFRAASIGISSEGAAARVQQEVVALKPEACRATAELSVLRGKCHVKDYRISNRNPLWR